MLGQDEQRDHSIRVVDGSTVTRAVWSRVLQHPSTLAPLALCLLSSTYLGLIELNKGVFAAALGGGLLTLGSIVYHYFIRGEDHAKQVAVELLGQREQEVLQQSASLMQALVAVGFKEGETQLIELQAAYDKLVGYLEAGQARQKRAGISRFKDMARDCRAEGLRILQLALTTFQALRETNARKLKSERDEWLRQAAVIQQSIKAGNAHQQTRYDALLARANAHGRTLERYEQRRHDLEQLLAQSEILEGALEAAYLDVIDLLEQTVPGRDDAASRLEGAVAAARAVEERLRAPQASADDDDEYLRAAGRSES